MLHHTFCFLEIPVASHEVVSACIAAGEQLGNRCHVGTTRTADTFYALKSVPGFSFNNYWHSNWKDFMEDLRRMNIMVGEMEASIILVLARLWGLRAGGIAVVVQNAFKSQEKTQASGKYDPKKFIDHGAQHIERLAKMGSEAIRILYEKDQVGK